MTYAISMAVSVVCFLAAPVALVGFVMHWVQIAGYSGRLASKGGGKNRRRDDDDRDDEE